MSRKEATLKSHYDYLDWLSNLEADKALAVILAEYYQYYQGEISYLSGKDKTRRQLSADCSAKIRKICETLTDEFLTKPQCDCADCRKREAKKDDVISGDEIELSSEESEKLNISEEMKD